MSAHIEAATLKAWLGDGREIALLDVSEHGQYGNGHPFFAVSLPYSGFELRLAALVPNRATRVVLCDAGDRVAEKAAARAAAAGYRDVVVLEGGKPAWERTGYRLFAGVNVPSKTFGELIAHACATPHIAPEALAAMRERGEDVIVIDGRPLAEFRKMSIPGAICCPNGELALRIKQLVRDPATKIVVNCAGRTRSIIGAQTLRDLQIPNPVYALENGTQGWFLAGFTLAHGAEPHYPDEVGTDTDTLGRRAREFAQARGAKRVAAADAIDWISDPARSTYLLDIRTAEEFARCSLPGFVHAPGGQLVQAIDQWVAVRGARLVLADDEMVRAPVVAGWLRALGHEAYALDGGVTAALSLARPQPTNIPAPPHLAGIAPQALADGKFQVIDLRPAMMFRQGHIAQAKWSIRPRIAAAVNAQQPIALVAEMPAVAALAAIDLKEAGATDIRLVSGGPDDWRTAGLSISATPNDPADAEAIDFLFFAHARHDGDATAARQYLAWETGLLDQLDAQERGSFRL
jgi:rhodanese-related sulfurtransferase